MRETRRKFVMFSFYDRTGIERYLEKQAQKGWILDKTTGFGWHFHRIKPKKVHFFVSYFPKASAFDPEPSEQQRSFQEFCEYTGWKLAASSAQMQIFYNEQDAPVPIETEAILEIEQIHAAAKKNFLPNYFLLILAGVVQAVFFGWRLFTDPVSVLTSNANLFTGVCWLLMILMSLAEVIGYFRWHKKALAAAELDGSFIETKGHTNFQIIALCIMLVAFASLLISNGGNKMSITAIISIVLVLGMTVIIVGFSEWMKKMKVSAKVNRTMTIVITFIVAFGFTGILLINIVSKVNDIWREKTPVDTYEFRGGTWEIYRDELPLVIEDLVETEYDGYSYEIWSEESSLIAERMEAIQEPRMDAFDQPELGYSVVTIHVPMFYECFRSALLDDFAHNYAVPVPEDDMWKKHVETDALPWGANEAYQLWIGGEPKMRFLLCYDKCIVEIDFDDGWELTTEQMAIVGEKLGEK